MIIEKTLMHVVVRDFGVGLAEGQELVADFFGALGSDFAEAFVYVEQTDEELDVLLLRPVKCPQLVVHRQTPLTVREISLFAFVDAVEGVSSRVEFLHAHTAATIQLHQLQLLQLAVEYVADFFDVELDVLEDGDEGGVGHVGVGDLLHFPDYEGDLLLVAHGRVVQVVHQQANSRAACVLRPPSQLFKWSVGSWEILERGSIGRAGAQILQLEASRCEGGQMGRGRSWFPFELGNLRSGCFALVRR